jgi:RES domain-containing protein
LELYRLLRSRYAGTNPFDGEGSFLFGGRWSSVGTRVCYTAAHRSLAILEYRVNMDPEGLPDDLVLATLEVPDDLAIASVEALPVNWRAYPAPENLRLIGDRFIREGRTALMRVPSVIVPEEDNVLVNPDHPYLPKPEKDYPLTPFAYDLRLLAGVTGSRSTP